MEKTTITKIIAIIVIVVAVLVLLGWIFDIPALKSVSQDWVSMKIRTAIGFILSGIILYAMVGCTKDETSNARAVLFFCSMALLFMVLVVLTATGLCTSLFLGTVTSIDKEIPEIKTSLPSIPSVGTSISFLLISFAGILSAFHNRKHYRVIGGIIFTIGLAAIVGYILNISYIYYFIEGLSSAMAFNTAALFTLMGIGIWLLHAEEYTYSWK